MTPLPVPEADLESQHFFAALDDGQLKILRCDRCGTAHLAVLACNACGGTTFSSEDASGLGVVYSFTRTHIAHHPAFTDRLPFLGGIVELEEGPRLFAPLLGDQPVAIGTTVALELLPAEGRNIAAFRMRQAP